MASCGDPGLIDRGDRTRTDFSHGQIVTYQCIFGYSLEGSRKLTFDNGHWDSASPQCKGGCFLLSTFVFFSIPTQKKNRSFFFRKGIDVFHVMQNVLCSVNRSSCFIDNVTFTSLASCDPLKAPRNGKLKNGVIKHSSLVSFSYNDGFQMNGLRILKCINGKWNGSAPSCKGVATFSFSVVFSPFTSFIYTFSSFSFSSFTSSFIIPVLLFFLPVTNSSNNAYMLDSQGCRYNFKIMFVYGFVSVFKVYVKTQERVQME